MAVGEVWEVHVDPLVVARIVPLAPAAKQALAVQQKTPSRAFAVPELRIDQLVPFVVLRVVSVAPTMRHAVVLTQEISISWLALGSVWADHVVPLVVARIVPAPAAKQWVVLGQAIP